MSHLLEKFQALLKPQAQQGVPAPTWPDANNSEYWDDNSVNKYELPPDAVTEWKPTDDQQIPGYRGVEAHGVPFDSSVNYVIPIPQDIAEANEVEERKAVEASVPVEEEIIIQPIPVAVVSTPEPIGRQNRVAISSFVIPSTGNTAVRIAPASQTRSLLKISVLNADVVFIHTDAQGAVMSGYPITAGKGDVELDTTESVYAYAQTGTPMVYVLETHSVEVNERVN